VPLPARKPADEPPKRRASAYDGIDLDDLHAERRELEREVERCRVAVARAARLPRLVAIYGLLAVLLVTSLVVAGISTAFLAYGSINYRYLTVYTAIFVTVCSITVAILAWAARDPRAPVRVLPRRRLVATLRALRDVERAIARREGESRD
jgi:hypothetical protein